MNEMTGVHYNQSSHQKNGFGIVVEIRRVFGTTQKTYETADVFFIKVPNLRCESNFCTCKNMQIISQVNAMNTPIRMLCFLITEIEKALGSNHLHY